MAPGDARWADEFARNFAQGINLGTDAELEAAWKQQARVWGGGGGGPREGGIVHIHAGLCSYTTQSCDTRVGCACVGAAVALEPTMYCV